MQKENNEKLANDIDIDKGLTTAQVEKRIKNNLVNYDNQPKTKTIREIIESNFFTFFNYINLALGLAIVIGGIISGEFLQSLKNCFFMGVVIINSIIAIIQEVISKKIIDKLSLLTATKTEVIRDGEEKLLLNEEIVLDDIVVFSPGNQVPVDCRIKKGSVEVNEAFITGESDPVYKSTHDIINSGSFIVSGKCYAQVIRVGAETTISQISSGAKYIKKTNSVIMNSFEKILKVISFFIIPTAIIMYLSQLKATDYNFAESLFTTVAAIIGMIPEGLILLTSSVMAVSIIRMSKYNVLVQELYSIEALARVDVLCLDKTGTITTGEMSLKEVVYSKKVEPKTVDNILNAICYNTENSNITMDAIKEKYNEEIDWHVTNNREFSSARKYSAITFKDKGTFYLGAPEFVLKDKTSKYLKEIEEYQSQYRVLVLAKNKEKISDNPQNLQILAYILIEDVIRKEASKTLKYFKSQNVDVRIISGDNVNTISSIARQVGINDLRAIDISEATDDELEDIVNNYNIYSRVNPKQKQTIIKLLQKQGHTVAMVGDGINDVLALKASDCAVTVASASDSAKCVSQLVLLDSNFDSLPKVVAEGRRSINNIGRSASLMLVKTIYTILLILFSIGVSTRYFFVPIQLSLITTFTMSIPSFILALEPNKELVSGNFLLKIISKSLPVSLTVVFNIMIITFFKMSFGLSEELSSTLSVFLTSTIGFIFLYRLCTPFNRLRRNLYIVLLVGFLYCSFYQYEFFNLSEINFDTVVIFMILFIVTKYVYDKLCWLVEKAIWLYSKYLKGLNKEKIKQMIDSKIGVIQK
ncbi:MAG: HAD-IC family P-type ATPase [Bacilli bacterium]|nr:HAD-IC family P-type ATPase [Bacilli bacterium]